MGDQEQAEPRSPSSQLPDGEVAKALKRLWARVRATPRWKTIGILNIAFGALGVIGGCIAITQTIRHYVRAADFWFDMPVRQVERERQLASFCVRFALGSALQLASAVFLAVSGVLLLTRDPRGRKAARAALLLIPAAYVLSCVIHLYPFPPDWTQALTGLLSVVRARWFPLVAVIGVIGWAWVVLFPLLTLRALRGIDRSSHT